MPLDSQSKSNIAIVTKEWPPEIYGGAGVHVINLVESLKKFSDTQVRVHCFGSERPDASAYQLSPALENLNSAMKTLLLDMDIAEKLANVDLVHSHTWYANFTGFLAAKIFEIPTLLPRIPSNRSDHGRQTSLEVDIQFQVGLSKFHMNMPKGLLRLAMRSVLIF